MSRLTGAGFWRRSLVLPAEHGSWAWLLVPLLAGALAGGGWNAAVSWLLLGGLAAFLLRQPATVWLRVRQGRGRRATGRPALAWLALLGGTAVLSLAFLLRLGRQDLLWLAPPLLVVLAGYLLVASRRRADVRSLGMELAGVVGLAALAPAAFIAANGGLAPAAWWLWALLAGLNGLSLLYVRRRIADTHGRTGPRWRLPVMHGVGLAAVALAVLGGWLPGTSVLPFALLLIRAAWTAARPRPIPNVKRFGFLEVAVELAGGLLIAAGYW